MIFEVFRKSDRNYCYIDGISNMFPWDVIGDPSFKTWRKSVAITHAKFETYNFIITSKF